MSWEVPIMRSKTSFFNTGIAKNLLRRCWPLWVAYLLGLLVLVPMPLLLMLREPWRYSEGVVPMNQNLASIGGMMIFYAFAVGAVTAMAMFSYLYQNRSCGLMNSLPVTRTTTFFTAYLTGLLPLLISQVLTALVTALLCTTGRLDPMMVLNWFLLTALSTLFFYGFACFCAMLTGSLLVLPLVYAVLNFAVYVAESCAVQLLSLVVYGMESYGSRLAFLSPPVMLSGSYGWEYVAWPNQVQVRGLGVAALYALAGLVLTVLAWRLYLRRQMERATDTVAIPVLKPVFKYCMTFGTALVFADLLYNMTNLPDRGLPMTLIVLGLMLIGAFLGYFVAEMLIQKTVKVFRGRWKGFVLSACAIAVLIAAAELDVTGYERRLPKEEQIDSVMVNSVEYRQPENIRKILDFQQSLIHNKAKHEKASGPNGNYYMGSDQDWVFSNTVTFRYRLKNGKEFARYYWVTGDNRDWQDPNSDLRQWQELVNVQEALEYRCALRYPMAPENVFHAALSMTIYDEERGYYDSVNLPLTAQELTELWSEGVLPDLAEGKMARQQIRPEGADWANTNVSIYFQLRDPQTFTDRGGAPETMQWMDLAVSSDAEHCLDWIEQHTGQRPRPLEEGEVMAIGVG